MKILYFSGTGNSFYVAKKLANHFAGSSVESIARRQNDAEVVFNDEEIVIISPIYFYSLPHIVINFLGRVQFPQIKYLSVILTAEYPNGIAINALHQLCKSNHLAINSCFYLQMPTNYLIKSKMLEPEAIETVIGKADKKLNKIIEIIENKKNFTERDSIVYSILVNAKKSNSEWEREFTQFDSGFSVTDKCNHCKICEKHCPVGNITISEKLTWNGNCEACLKCINFCPRQAIQYENMTEGKKRYFNPKVKISEFH